MSFARGQSRSGTAAVEFALCAPLLFLMVFAAIEFARANMLRLTVDHAAYEAARKGIVAGASTEDVRAAASSMLSAVGTRGASIVVEPAVLSADAPILTVTITVPVRDNSWGVAHWFRASSTLSSSCTLARELHENIAIGSVPLSAKPSSAASAAGVR